MSAKKKAFDVENSKLLCLKELSMVELLPLDFHHPPILRISSGLAFKIKRPR